MLSLRLEASASIHDWIDPSQQSPPFGRGGAAILIDMSILVCTQIETWGAPGTPLDNWTYEIRHYDQHLNLLGMVSTGPLPFESFHCYFVPNGGYGALLMVGNGDSTKTYRTAFVSGAAAVPTVSAFTTRTSTIATGEWAWGWTTSRCQWIDGWNVVVLANGKRGIHVFDPSGAELANFSTGPGGEFTGEMLTWNLRGDDLYLATYSQTAGYQLAEYRLTQVSFSSYTFTKIGDFMPEAPTGAASFQLWGLGLGGASVDPRPISWYGQYFPDPGGGFSSRFRWFKTADATTGAILNTKEMTIVGDMDTDFSNAIALYPVEDFYSAVNTRVGETYFAGQLGGEQFTYGLPGEYPSFAIHIIGLDATTGEQTFLALPIPGVHGEQDTLSAGSVTFCVRNHRWVVTCTNVNLDDFSGHDHYSTSVWTGSVHSLTMWDGTKWRILGNKFDTEPGRLNLQMGETGHDWVEEIREGEDVGESVVAPLHLDDSTGHGPPWFSTSAGGYPQASGWVPRTDPVLAGLITYVGGTPYIAQADAESNYVAVSQPVDHDGNLIFVSTFWDPIVPTGDIVSAYVEFQVRGNGGTGDPHIRWGIAGAQFYFTDFDIGTEQPRKVPPNVWWTHRMSLLDERFSTQTKAKFVADLSAGVLNAGVNMDRAFDVSAIRLVVQYAEVITRPLKMWIPDAVGTFAGWVEVIRLRIKGQRGPGRLWDVAASDLIAVTDSHTVVGGTPVGGGNITRSDLLAIRDSVSVVSAGATTVARTDRVNLTDTKTYSLDLGPGSSGFLRRSGAQVTLNGAPWRGTGVNLTWSLGCGSEVGLTPSVAQHATMFAAAKPNSIYRMFVFGGTSLSLLDQILNAARPYGHRFIPVLSDRQGGCGEPYAGAKTDAFLAGGWATGGWRDNWLNPVINRYRNEPLIGWWEWINEAHPTQAFRDFLDDVGSYVRGTLGDTHLIGTGTQSEYGNTAGMRLVNASPYIDLCSQHEYDATQAPSNWTNEDAADAAFVGKPWYVGESGILPSQYASGTARANQIKAKIAALHTSWPTCAAYVYWSGAAPGFSGAASRYEISINGSPEINVINTEPF